MSGTDTIGLRYIAFLEVTNMFSILLRVLTIAGSCTLAALITRRLIYGRAPKNEDLQHSENEKAARSASTEKRSENSASAEAEKKSETEKQTIDLEAQRKRREEMQAKADQIKQRSDERSEKIAKSKQAAQAARDTVKAFRKEQEAQGKLPQSSKLAEKGRSDNLQETDFSVPDSVPDKDPARERARVIMDSSRKILDSYKQPAGLNVDLSLARFSIETADRLFSESRFDDAWEKAGSVGMIVGMAEMRAGIEQRLNELRSNPENADKLKEVRDILSEADASLAEAGKSFVNDKEKGDGDFMKELQIAFSKTMKAQKELG